MGWRRENGGKKRKLDIGVETSKFDGGRVMSICDLDTLFSIFNVNLYMQGVSFSVFLCLPDSQADVYMDLRLEFLPKLDFASPVT